MRVKKNLKFKLNGENTIKSLDTQLEQWNGLKQN